MKYHLRENKVSMRFKCGLLYKAKNEAIFSNGIYFSQHLTEDVNGIFFPKKFKVNEICKNCLRTKKGNE